MRIAVLGAGGVGGYFGGLLARAGHDVRLLARGDHLAAIRGRGLRIRTPDDEFTADPRAMDQAGLLGPVDAVVVAVKSYSLAEVAPTAAALAEDGADVAPLLNGVEAVDTLAGLGVPEGRLLAGVAYISAARVEPGVVERKSPFQRVIVGEPGGGVSERARSLARAFTDAGADGSASPDIETELWRKLVFLASVSAACGLSRTAVGPLREASGGMLLLERAAAECVAVGRARGVALAEDEEARAMELFRGLPGHLVPSFVLDVRRGGRTELDILSGAVSRLGREAGVDTPVHDTVTAALGAADRAG